MSITRKPLRWVRSANGAEVRFGTPINRPNLAFVRISHTDAELIHTSPRASFRASRAFTLSRGSPVQHQISAWVPEAASSKRLINDGEMANYLRTSV